MSVLIGLDVQLTRLGFGVVDLGTGAPLGCGAMPLVTRSPRLIRQSLNMLGWRHDVALVYVEAPHVGPNRMGSLRHAMTIGSVIQACDRRWPNAPVELITSPEWKRACGLKGNATKAGVMSRARELHFAPETQDAADAACIAYAGWCANERTVAESERARLKAAEA